MKTPPTPPTPEQLQQQVAEFDSVIQVTPAGKKGNNLTPFVGIDLASGPDRAHKYFYKDGQLVPVPAPEPGETTISIY